jgi:hypothetical protein
MKKHDQKWQIYHGLIEMLMLMMPEVSPEVISKLWKTHPVLKRNETIKKSKLMHYIKQWNDQLAKKILWILLTDANTPEATKRMQRKHADCLVGRPQ